MISPLIIVALISGIACLSIGMLIGASSSAELECPTCEDGRVVLHAGDVERDDGFCELKLCPTCRGGERIGRSDVPIAGPVPTFARGGRIPPPGGDVIPIDLHRGETLLPPRPDRPQDN